MIKKLHSRIIDRYEYGDYIMEVEVSEEPERGLMYWFWLVKRNVGYKMGMFGWPADQRQAKEPRIFTKDEAVDLALNVIDEYIDSYECELCMMEYACCPCEEDCCADIDI